MLKNVKTEVLAASAGAGSGGAVAGFLLWLLGVLLWHVPDDAAHATAAVSAVPLPVILFLPIALAVIGALLGGHKGPQGPILSGGASGAGSPASGPQGAFFDPSTFLPSLSPGLSALTGAISDVIGGSVPDVPLVDHADGTVPPPDYPSAALIPPAASPTPLASANTSSNSTGSVPITVVTPVTPGAVSSPSPAAAASAPALPQVSPTTV